MANENETTPKSDEGPTPKEITQSTTAAYDNASNAACTKLDTTIEKLNQALGTNVRRVPEGRLVVTIEQFKP